MNRILVIDDNDDIRGALTAILEDAGHDVEGAADGNEANALAASQRPDVARSSALCRRITDSARALSWETPRLPTDVTAGKPVV